MCTFGIHCFEDHISMVLRAGRGVHAKLHAHRARAVNIALVLKIEFLSSAQFEQ